MAAGLLVVLGGLATCAVETRTAEPTRQVGPGEMVRVSGVATGISDVAQTPDYPLDHGMLIVAPVKAMRSVPLRGRLDNFTVTKELYDEVGVAFCALAPDGSYSVSVEPGEYALWLGNFWGGERGASFPVRVHGQVRVTVGSAAAQTIDITHFPQTRYTSVTTR